MNRSALLHWLIVLPASLPLGACSSSSSADPEGTTSGTSGTTATVTLTGGPATSTTAATTTATTSASAATVTTSTGGLSTSGTGGAGTVSGATTTQTSSVGGAATTGADATSSNSTGGASSLGGAGGTGGAANGPVGELPGSACTREFQIPSFQELPTNAKMPDPFTFLDGSKVTTKEDWVCRQKEISELAQAYIYGPKPPPPETLNASFANGTLTLDMENAGRQWTLTVDITTPSGEGPFPAVFDVDAGPPMGVGSIETGLNWLTGQVAAAGNGRGTTGPFYTFFPDFTATGSLMAWAWVASRIIDGLEMTTGHRIDTTKLYGLGCSRNGKTAATMALFDQRMAMVAMYSPGSGTTSGWRVAEAQTTSVQTAGQIYGETTWMGEAFGQFGNNVNKLPVDQHEVLALAWPRPILVREGTNDSWNCPVCVYTTLKYTQLIYEALGNQDAVGFTHYNGGHCESGGQDWTTTYGAFVQKYLFDDASVSTAGRFDEKFTFDAAKWQDGDLAPIP